MKQKLLLPIAVLFAATLLISNTLEAKMFMLGDLVFPAGIILFPLAYLFGDVLTEVYGYNASRKVIWSGFAALALMVVFYELASVLPPAPFWKSQEAFDATLSQVPRIVAASMIAYLCGEFVNSYIVAKMKVKMAGRKMWLRFLASTFVGQFVDTIVFISIAFSGVFAFSELISIIISAWLVKVGWETIALPITLATVKWIKKVENEDYYDTNTDFNPFSIGGASDEK
jgi:uncharacterized integral membrane protein (TIGR00697 family)